VSVVNEAGESCGSLTYDLPTVEIGDDELVIDEYREPMALIRAARAPGVFVDTGRQVSHRLIKYDLWTLA
jgi:hypothetical protein